MKQSVHSAGYYNKNGKEMNFTVEICREIIIMSELPGIVFFYNIFQGGMESTKSEGNRVTKLENIIRIPCNGGTVFHSFNVLMLNYI